MILPPFYLSAKQMPGMELLCGPISRQNKKVVTPGDTVISGLDLKTAIWKFPAIFSAAMLLFIDLLENQLRQSPGRSCITFSQLSRRVA